MFRSLARAYSALPAAAPATPERTSFGGLKDENRIFTNLYCRHDPFLKVCSALGQPLARFPASSRMLGTATGPPHGHRHQLPALCSS